MKTFGKIVICIIVVLVAIGIGYLAYNVSEKETGSNALKDTNTSADTQNKTNNSTGNKTTNEIDENKDYIGEEENKEEPREEGESEKTPEQETEKEEQKPEELTGKDKAIDIVKKQYAMEGQTVSYDHMEGTDYIIKINEGTAVTWYLVNGTTWEAEEY